MEIIKLTNKSGTSIALSNYGAAWLSWQVPLASGELREILLSSTNLTELKTQSAYLGVAIGRYANRIKNAQFELAGKKYKLSANQDGKHHLHGGEFGFYQREWDIKESTKDSVKFNLISTDGDQGYPGNVKVELSYKLTENNEVEVHFTAVTDQATPINLTVHPYFNLDGASATGSILEHSLQVNADYYLPVDAEGIPSASLTSVANSNFDFRNLKKVGADLLENAVQQYTKGYDHSFLLNNNSEQPAVRLISSKQDLSLELYTNKPAVQIYSANYLAGIVTQDGVYQDYAGIAIEPQFLPDSPNHPEWLSEMGGILMPNQTYNHSSIFKLQL